MTNSKHGTSGAGGQEGRWPPTRWNPTSLTTNCGFCAISYALEKQKGKFVDADELYLQTLQHLGIEKKGDRDPIPRTLIFPAAKLDETAIRTEYQELEGRGHGPSNYTIWSVAHLAGLDLKSGDKVLLNSLVEFAAHSAPRLKLDDFVQARMRRPDLPGKASFASMKTHVENSLNGNSIIGSIARKHFVNLSISQLGELNVFDAQRGMSYDGHRIKVELGQLDLFERVSTGPTR